MGFIRVNVFLFCTMEFGSAGGLERSVPNLDGLEKKQAC